MLMLKFNIHSVYRIINSCNQKSKQFKGKKKYIYQLPLKHEARGL